MTQCVGVLVCWCVGKSLLSCIKEASVGTLALYWYENSDIEEERRLLRLR